jgi:hypothetical protein
MIVFGRRIETFNICFLNINVALDNVGEIMNSNLLTFLAGCSSGGH